MMGEGVPMMGEGVPMMGDGAPMMGEGGPRWGGGVHDGGGGAHDGGEGSHDGGRCPWVGEGCKKSQKWLKLLVCSTHHQHIPYNSWSLVQKFWMFFSQVMKKHSHSSEEVLWLANIHPKT